MEWMPLFSRPHTCFSISDTDPSPKRLQRYKVFSDWQREKETARLLNVLRTDGGFRELSGHSDKKGARHQCKEKNRLVSFSSIPPTVSPCTLPETGVTRELCTAQTCTRQGLIKLVQTLKHSSLLQKLEKCLEDRHRVLFVEQAASYLPDGGLQGDESRQHLHINDHHVGAIALSGVTKEPSHKDSVHPRSQPGAIPPFP